MEEQRKRVREEVLLMSDKDTDSDVIEIGSSRSDGGKRRRPTTPPDLHEVVVLEDIRDHTRPTRSKKSTRTRRKKLTSPPTPPHVEPHYISSSGESEEEEDEREEREANEAGLYYCGPQDPYPASFEEDAAFARAPEDEGFLSLRDLEEANTATATHPGDGLAADDYDDGIEWRECAICLSRPTRRDGAVVEGCYHSFCFVCIAHWAALNPACPLCKRRFNAVLHDLRLMPGPAARLHFRRYSLADAAAAAAVVSPSSSRVATRNVVSRARAPIAATSTRDVAVGILQASTHKTSGESYGGSAPSASDTDVDRRRRVYARCLRAVPPAALTTASEGPGSSLELAFARRLPDVAREWETKLKPWVVRELQAVLEEDDVDLLAIMTRSLLDDYARRTLPLRRGRINAATSKKTTTTTATAARASANSTTADEHAAQVAWGELRARLEEFLVNDAAIFLHELLCFAVSPYRDMGAYDSAVRYPILPPS